MMMKIFQITLSLGLFLLPLTSLHSQGYVFGPNIRISDYTPGTAYAYTANAGQRGVAVRGDTVYCVWADDRTGNWGVWFTKSTDGGQTFSPNVQVDDGLYAAVPTLAVGEDGTIHVAWDGQPSPFNYLQVFFSKSTDGGLTFSPDIVVNDTAGGIKDRPHRNPSMAVDTAGIIYIAFDDGRNGPGNYDIYFSKSSDGGLTFTQDVLVNDTIGDTLNDREPAIALSDDGIIYVGWDKAAMWLYVSRSTDSGVSFESDVLVNDTIVESWSNSVDIDARGYVHIAWRDGKDGNYNIYYARSTDGGLTFAPDIRVNDAAHEPGPQTYPSVCVDDTGMVYAVWENGPATMPDIFFTSSTDTQDTSFVEPNIEVDDTDSTCWAPSVAVGDSGRVYVLWKDFRNPAIFMCDVYFAAGSFEGGIEEKDKNPQPANLSITASPNPFSISTIITLHRESANRRNEETVIQIYDVSGRKVREISLLPSCPVRESFSNGVDISTGAQAMWDGCNQNSRSVAAGVYFIRMETGSFLSTKKVLLVR